MSSTARLLALWGVAVCCSLAPLPGSSELETVNLTDALSSGKARIVLAKGKGLLSGKALDAVLLNFSVEGKLFESVLREPLYLANKGEGQDMLVTRVLLGGGTYYTDGEQAVLPVPEGIYVVPISLVAYSVDIGKANPGDTDEFQVQEIPARLKRIAHAASRLERLYLDDDDAHDFVMNTIQVALWRAQGVPPDRIAERYPYSPQHAEAARLLLESQQP